MGSHAMLIENLMKTSRFFQDLHRPWRVSVLIGGVVFELHANRPTYTKTPTFKL